MIAMTTAAGSASRMAVRPGNHVFVNKHDLSSARGLRFTLPLQTLRVMPPKPKKTTLLTLTEDQRTEIRQAFDLFDSEGQGASILHCSLPRSAAKHAACCARQA